MRKAAVLCGLAVLAMFALPSVQAAERPPLPDDVLIMVEVANPAQYEKKLQNLALRLVPGAPPVPLRQGIAAYARTDDPSVLDLSAPLHWVACRGQDPASPIFAFSVLDSQRYLDTFPMSLHGGEEDGNLRLFEEDGDDPFGPRTEPLAIAVVGKRVLLGRSADGVRSVVPLVEQGAIGAEPFFPGADAAAALRPSALVADMTARGTDPFDLARDQLAAMRMGMPVQGEQNVRNLEVVLNCAQAAAGQVEVVTGTMSVTPQAIVCTAGVQPAEGSALAAHLPTMQPIGQELLTYMPVSSAALLAGHIGDPNGVLEPYMGLIATMAPQDGSAAEAQARIKDGMAESVASLDGRFASAVVVSPTGSFAFANAAGVTDGARAEGIAGTFKKVADDLATLQSEIGEPFTARIVTTPNFGTHAGHAITEWRYDFEFKEPDPTMPGAAQAAAVQKELTAAMFGPEFRGYSAVRENALVMFQGAGTLDALKAALDGSLASITEEPRYAASMAGMPTEPVMVGYVALGELFGAYMRMTAKAMEAAGMPFFGGLANLQFAPAPAVGFAAAVNDAGALEGRLVIPVEALSSLVNGFMQAFMGGGMRPTMMP